MKYKEVLIKKKKQKNIEIQIKPDEKDVNQERINQIKKFNI